MSLLGNAPGGFVEVAGPLPIRHTFTYRIPSRLSGALQVGSRVVVPFQRRKLTGLVLEVHDRNPEVEAKPLLEQVDPEPILGAKLLELGRWISDYYLAAPGEVFRVMLPPGLLGRKRPEKKKYWPSKRRLAIVKLAARPPRSLTSRQQEIWLELQKRTLPVLLAGFCRQVGCGDDVLRRMADQGALEIEKVDVYRSPFDEAGADQAEVRHVLTSEQSAAWGEIRKALDRGGFQRMLLFGVTGSGKTEVYLNAIERVLEKGQSALVLVPEIGLTPQMSRAFRSWFGDQVAIQHSGLSDGERFDQWRRIRSGRCRVVVGTRSAVFTPLAKLGMIIVDEEHDSSYKQEEMPRYHGRDTALKRGQLEDALVLLGSATPQLETFHGALEKKRFRCLKIPKRILDRPMPTVHVVDMRHEFERHGKAALFSTLLEDGIGRRLQLRQQVLILLNRRGYAAAVLCRSCGGTETCPHCSISLTHHLDWNRLLCHYCGYARSLPEKCRECGKPYIYYVGEGTEKIQQWLEGRFPEARIDRLDRDSVRRRGSLQRILSRFAGHRTDILVGTQMIAKGHDFPQVTLVGVLSAEMGLRIADFRAAERTFQLLTQVSGRAGRGEEPGDVIVQTYYPNHYSLKYACQQDYEEFYRREVVFRSRFRYPPFTALANLVVRGEKREEVRDLAASLAQSLKRHRKTHSDPQRLRILGPAPAALERLRKEYRHQILIKTTNRAELHRVLGGALGEVDGSSRRRIVVDVDPVNLL